MKPDREQFKLTRSNSSNARRERTWRTARAWRQCQGHSCSAFNARRGLNALPVPLNSCFFIFFNTRFMVLLKRGFFFIFLLTVGIFY